MADPALVVRVTGNLDDLKRAMVDSERTVSAATGQMQKFTAATERAVPAGRQVTDAYRQVDGVLRTMGVNIGPQVKAIEDIANASGKSVKEFGALGTAGAVLGAGMAGWGIGRAVAEFFDLDQKIANATARVMNYGDVAAETAGAKQDTINKAIANGAAVTISYTDAIQFNIKAMEKKTGVTEENTKILDSNADHMAKLADQLNDLEQKRLNASYRTETHTASTKANTKAVEESTAASEVYRSEAHFTTEVIVEQTKAIDERIERFKAEAAAFSEAQKTMAVKPTTLNDRPSESWFSEVRNLTVTDLEGLRQKNPLLTGEQNIREELKRLESLEGTYAPKSGAQFAQMMRDQYLLAQLRMFFKDGRQLAGGVENFGGGMAIVGERGPEIVDLPGGSNVIPNHALGGPSITNHIHLSGVIGSKQEIADYISKILVDKMRGQGVRFGVGA